MNIQSYSDIITNSSSELFVFRNENSVESLKSWLNALIPGWEDEYDDPIDILDANDEEIEIFVNHHHNLYNAEKRYIAKLYGTKEEYPNMPNITCEEFQERKNEISYYANFAKILNRTVDELYCNWERYNPYMFENVNNTEKAEERRKKYDWFIKPTKLFYDIMKEIDNGVFLMFSKDDNPDYDRIQELESMADVIRYHLG